jgi:hypothetical protein
MSHPSEEEENESSSSKDPENQQTDPTLVQHPIDRFVHKKLRYGWKVHPQHQMCYIFDFVTPARQWKRGTKYTDANPFAFYGPAPWPDLTETDDDGVLQPYYPREFR